MVASEYKAEVFKGTTSNELWTFEDAVEHLMDFFSLRREDRDVRMARRAVLTAYRDLPFKHRWSYYERIIGFNSEASQDSGTVAYDHTGGTNERELTLTDNTWPSNAARGWVLVDDERYRIETRVSDTVVTLALDSNPGADVSSGTSYEWYRDIYDLPVNFRRATPLMEIQNSWQLQYVTPAQIHQIEAGDSQPSRPYAYTFLGGSEYYGGMSIKLTPPPSEARHYEFFAEVAPRPLKTEKYDVGTVTISSGSTTVNGTSTVFSSDHVGSILRIAPDGSAPPTSLVGSHLPNSSGTLNPFVAQRVIKSVSSDTSATIDSEISSSTTYTDAQYTISDPIDVEAGSMFTYFLRLAEMEMARYLRNEDFPKFLPEERRALRAAMAADNRSKDLATYATDRVTDLGDWAIIDT